MAKRRSEAVQRLAQSALACLCALVPGVSNSAGTDEAVLALRFYDDNVAARGNALSISAQRAIERVAGVALVARGRNADGAFLFAFALPATAAEARSAANRLRGTGAVVYADVVRHAPTKSRIVQNERVNAFIIKMHPSAKQASAGLSVEVRDRIAAKAGFAIAASRPLSGDAELLTLAIPVDATTAAQVIARIASDPDIAHVEPDRRAMPQLMPADPLFAAQWNLTDPVGGINVTNAWDLTTGGPAAPIAFLDTGVLPHPDLSGRVAGGYDFIADANLSNDGDGRDADPTDAGDYVTTAESTTPGSPLESCPVSTSTWHGTMVAGTLGAAVNNDGVSGVNWTSPLVNVRVLGKCGGALSDIADGIRWAAGLPVTGVPANPMPARIINLSLKGNGDCGSTLQSAVTDALARGAVIVAAAGNDNDDVANHWPANCNGVIAVAATSKNGSRAFYSNWGVGIAVSAPGGGIGGSITTLRNTGATAADPAGYGYGSQVGSSLAAPHVAGIASLMVAFDPGITPAEVRSAIETTARSFPVVPTDPCTTAACGAGIADAAAALASLNVQPAPPGSGPPDALPPIDMLPQPPPSKPPPSPEPPTSELPTTNAPSGGELRAKTTDELARLIKD